MDEKKQLKIFKKTYQGLFIIYLIYIGCLFYELFSGIYNVYYLEGSLLRSNLSLLFLWGVLAILLFVLAIIMSLRCKNKIKEIQINIDKLKLKWR